SSAAALPALTTPSLHDALPIFSRPLVAEIVALRDELRAAGVRRVVLAGMGGSSLAPEVIAQTAGVPLTILDSTAPGQVLAALDRSEEHTSELHHVSISYAVLCL